ncbi:hypothetical protein KAW80_00060 [Candidatus Babeliales bacterium]|nr:hypothetical protein [Candidatus Babeliales bacterium]
METETFELEIVRPTESKKISIFWLDIEGLEGSFVVGPNHSSLISILKPKSRMIYKTIQNLEVEIDIFGGVIKVGNNKALVILDN